MGGRRPPPPITPKKPRGRCVRGCGWAGSRLRCWEVHKPTKRPTITPQAGYHGCRTRTATGATQRQARQPNLQSKGQARRYQGRYGTLTLTLPTNPLPWFVVSGSWGVPFLCLVPSPGNGYPHASKRFVVSGNPWLMCFAGSWRPRCVAVVPVGGGWPASCWHVAWPPPHGAVMENPHTLGLGSKGRKGHTSG